MARVKQFDVITGSIANLSFYTRKGSDQVFVRTKGGASKSKIKRNPEFANLRKNNMEFGGCSTMSKHVRMSFNPLRNVADYNLAPALGSLMKSIQKMDTEGLWGERAIRLSHYRSLLTGFDFNRVVRFSSIFRMPVQWTIQRDSRQCAEVVLPAFACSYALYLPGEYGSFRFVTTLGVVSDHQIKANCKGYEPTHGDRVRPLTTIATEWYPTRGSVPEQKLTLKLSDPDGEFADDDTLILAIGIEFGTLDPFGNQTPLKGAGAGMILGTK